MAARTPAKSGFLREERLGYAKAVSAKAVRASVRAAYLCCQNGLETRRAESRGGPGGEPNTPGSPHLTPAPSSPTRCADSDVVVRRRANRHRASRRASGSSCRPQRRRRCASVTVPDVSANALRYSMTPKPKVTSPGSAMCTDTIASRRIHRPSSTSIHSPEYGTCPLAKLSTSSRSVPSSTVFEKPSSGGIVNVRVATVSEHTPVVRPRLLIVCGGTRRGLPRAGW